MITSLMIYKISDIIMTNYKQVLTIDHEFIIIKFNKIFKEEI
jgi:hypothetical protein